MSDIFEQRWKSFLRLKSNMTSIIDKYTNASLEIEGKATEVIYSEDLGVTNKTKLIMIDEGQAKFDFLCRDDIFDEVPSENNSECFKVPLPIVKKHVSKSKPPQTLKKDLKPRKVLSEITEFDNDHRLADNYNVKELERPSTVVTKEQKVTEKKKKIDEPKSPTLDELLEMYSSKIKIEYKAKQWWPTAVSNRLGGNGSMSVSKNSFDSEEDKREDEVDFIVWDDDDQMDTSDDRT